MENRKKILIIDDEENMRLMLTAILSRQGYQSTTAGSGAEGLKLLEREEFDFVLCDIKMANMDGLTFLQKARELKPHIIVIMMSAYGTIDTAVKAMKFGAYDYISKPFKIDEIVLILQKAEEREKLRQENVRLKEQLAAIGNDRVFGAMVANSKAMQDIFHFAAKVAQHKTTVLITGESGTGKELMARAIHDSSSRVDKPFVAINCGGVPESLLESEFFGYVKGAFTGADSNKKGLFSAAMGGTLFLDEIGELPLSLQVKLLRVLQENEIRPVGSNVTEPVDVRVIAATARNLEEEVHLGTFRKDLFFRLNVVRVHILPLRERKEDIQPLCNHFIKKLNQRLGRNIAGISPPALALLLQHDWPGNVRELENAMERAIILAEKDLIVPEYLPNMLGGAAPKAGIEDIITTMSLKEARKILEQRLIKRALEVTEGNKSKAAGLLEISYPCLLNKIKELNLEK